MKIYLVRHGESEGNISNVHQTEDSALSFEGMRQADKLAARFAGVAADKIIASPLVRTKQTAEAISKTTGLEIEYDSRIKELKRPSIVVGRSYHEPEVQKIWSTIDAHVNEPEYHYSDEENFFDLKKRITEFVEELPRRQEKDLVVVSHGYAIRTFIGVMVFGSEFSSHQFHDMTQHMSVSNTGITICDHTDGKEGWRVTAVNDAAHLLD